MDIPMQGQMTDNRPITMAHPDSQVLRWAEHHNVQVMKCRKSFFKLYDLWPFINVDLDRTNKTTKMFAM